MSQQSLEPQTRLALYYAAHPELHHADRAAERDPRPARAAVWSHTVRALRAHLRLARHLRAARLTALPGRPSL